MAGHGALAADFQHAGKVVDDLWGPQAQQTLWADRGVGPEHAVGGKGEGARG